MQTLELLEPGTSATAPGFLVRQFAQVPTVKQRKWDWTFGVVMPTLCIAADPFIFRSSIDIGGRLWLSDYQVGAYTLGILSTMGMVAWLLWGERLGAWQPLLAGLFFIASITAFVTGVIMLPVSLLGLILAIGIFGFTPFFSSFIFVRTAVRAFRGASASMRTDYVWHAAIVAALYAIVVPIVLNFR